MLGKILSGRSAHERRVTLSPKDIGTDRGHACRPEHVGRPQVFFENKEHQPCGLIAPSTVLQAFGA